jgi:DNA-directed RNA polymerase sigma subunit (sigma70/sigma32)
MTVREQLVVNLRAGGFSYAAIAGVLGPEVTPERVRQIEAKALREMKRKAEVGNARS